MLDKRISILNTLEDIIKSKRYHEVKIDDVAKKCKIGKGTIYTYFKSKDEMYYELAMHGLEVIAEEINSINIEGKDIKELIFCVARELSLFFEKREAVVKVLQELSNRTKIMTRARKERMYHNKAELRLSLSKILKVGVEQGLVIDSFSLNQISELMVHSLISRTHWDNDVPKMSVEDLITLIIFK